MREGGGGREGGREGVGSSCFSPFGHNARLQCETRLHPRLLVDLDIESRHSFSSYSLPLVQVPLLLARRRACVELYVLRSTTIHIHVHKRAYARVNILFVFVFMCAGIEGGSTR